jgi:hypothetical protein
MYQKAQHIEYYCTEKHTAHTVNTVCHAVIYSNDMHCHLQKIPIKCIYIFFNYLSKLKSEL